MNLESAARSDDGRVVMVFEHRGQRVERTAKLSREAKPAGAADTEEAAFLVARAAKSAAWALGMRDLARNPLVTSVETDKAVSLLIG